MRIGFDAKRAFSNYTGLGNYSRDTIRVLTTFFSETKYFLYTPKKTLNPRLNFIKSQNFPIEVEIVDDGEEILDTGGGILNMINRSNDNDFLVFEQKALLKLDKTLFKSE